MAVPPERFGPPRPPTNVSNSTSPEALLSPPVPDATPAYGSPLGAGGARLIILEAPAGLSFGIDSMSYTTGENFRGVRGVPVGLHLCHHSVGVGGGEGEGGGADGSGGRHGFFFRITEAMDVIVWKWDAGKEDLVPGRTAMPEGALTALDAAAIRGHLDGQLGPYPTEQSPVWAKLSQHLTVALFARCELPMGTKVLPGDAELDSDDEPAESAVVSYFGESGRAARFTATPPPLPRLKKPSQIVPGASAGMHTEAEAEAGGGAGDGEGAAAPATVPTRHAATLAAIPSDERTAWCTDTGARCEALVNESFGGEWGLLLGELQLAFLLFTLLYSAPALAHWKQSLALLCSCGHITVRRQHEVFAALCRLLQVQLRFLPEDFFVADLSKDNFLKPTLAGLFATVAHVQADAEAADREDGRVSGPKVVLEVGSADDGEGEGRGIDVSAPASAVAYASLWKGRNKLLALVQKRFGLWVEVNGGGSGNSAVDGDGDGDSDGGDADENTAAVRELLAKMGALTGFEDDDELPIIVDVATGSEVVSATGIGSASVGGGVGGGARGIGGSLDYSKWDAMAAEMGDSDIDSDDEPGAATAASGSVAIDDAALVAEYPSLYSARRENEDVVMAATRLVAEADALQGDGAGEAGGDTTLGPDQQEGRWMTPTERAVAARAQKQARIFLEQQVAKPGSVFWAGQQADPNENEAGCVARSGGLGLDA